MSAEEKQAGSAPVMDFSLYGGAFDGAVVSLRLRSKGETYLVKREHEDNPQICEVWTYEWADRTDAAGRWVLRAVCYVGHQGLWKQEGGA